MLSLGVWGGAAAVLMEPLSSEPSNPDHPRCVTSLLTCCCRPCAITISSCQLSPCLRVFSAGGNPVLGYLLGGAIVGPHALGLITDIDVSHQLRHQTHHTLLYLNLSNYLPCTLPTLSRVFCHLLAPPECSLSRALCSCTS